MTILESSPKEACLQTLYDAFIIAVGNNNDNSLKQK